jgi:putative ABC transport system permease protein
MLLIENIKLALAAIRVNKMRSFLTMLGIIIGISSVIAITSIGDSAKGAVSKEFEGYNAYMYLMVNWQMVDDGYISDNDMFSEEDIEALKERFSDDIRYAVPYTQQSSDTKVGRLDASLNISGVGANYEKLNGSIKMLHGRFINKGDVEGSRDNVVLDVKAARYLFNKDNVVGESVPVTVLGENKDLTIVGVYEVEESLFSSFGTSSSYSCYTPYSMLMYPGQGSSYIEIYANENKNQDEQGQAFAKYMTKIKDKEEGFYKFESAESQLSGINKVLGILSLAIGAIAAISLLVGGIGIMNIMLVSVTERTREIGIRKSLGARTNDILTQFLIEAMILSIIGGIIGTALGIGIATIGMTIAGIGIVINPMVIILAVSFSAFVGIFFGLFPARKAAKLDPIEALRFE